MISDNEAETLAVGSFHNRNQITGSTACGCYSCVTVFPGRNIERWTDDGLTACCPKCDIDAVLPEVTSIATLTDLRAYWFSPVATEPTRSTG